MKGATAEPFVKITSPPKRSITNTSGISQNFFRTRINSQNSTKKDTALLLKLFCHAARRWSRRITWNPITLRHLVRFQTEQILAQEAHEQTHRDHGSEI